MRFHASRLRHWPPAATRPVATSPPRAHRLLLPLQRLFKNDRVPHGWMAVSRYDEIEKDFTATYQEGQEALRTAILINCGAAEDVRALLRLEQRMNVRVVIIDSHRCGVLGGCWVLEPAEEEWSAEEECSACGRQCFQAAGSAAVCPLDCPHSLAAPHLPIPSPSAPSPARLPAPPPPLRLPPCRPICHLNNLDAEQDNIIVFLDESEGTTKADVPSWEDGEGGGASDDDGGGSDDENDPPAKQCVGAG